MTNHPNRSRGRPALPASERKVKVNLRLSPDVVDALRATGDGWMARADDWLREKVLSGS